MMTSPIVLPRNWIVGGLALALALTAFAPCAHANVYATNIKINGGTTNLSVQPGSSLSISYILNEPASAGVTVQVLSGATAVRSISLAGGLAGAKRGTNTVVWDGKDNGGNNVPGGNYSVSITAGSHGYSGWTITTDDNNDGNYSFEARGIAVDRNTLSPYYGRVLVGNSYDNSLNGTSPLFGNYLGIQKLNADGSYADEGGFSDGGVAWRGGLFSPWKIRVSDDDKVYVMDAYSTGDVYRFDPVISTNSMLHVLRGDNDGISSELSGMAIVGTGTNTQLWMTDDHSLGAGILKFTVTADGTCAMNDFGTTVVGVGGSLDLAPHAVSLDKSGNIYCVQQVFDQGTNSPRVLGFPAYDPGTNGGAPITNAAWLVPGSDDTAGAQGIAVDPTGTYVAACFWGNGSVQTLTAGNLKLYYATNGAVVTNIDLGVSIPSKRTTNTVPPVDPTHHVDTDSDWDAVGNLYYLDDGPGVWRAVSPPGTNQATTVALPVVQVIGAVQPLYITSIGVSASMVTIRFTGGSSDVASAFLLLSAPLASGLYSPAAGAVITGSGGSFQATVPANGPRQFYRIQRLSTSSLHITSLTVAGGTATINFTGSPSDAPSAFTLLSSAAANGTYTTAAGAIITGSSGAFQATVATSGPRQFYRIRK
jgi:FlgD Ig-like domain